MTETRHKRFAIIMAGGRGERFWPLSRESTPKQLIRLLGDTSLLQETVRRIQSVIPLENILVITNESQLKAVRRQLAQLPSANVIAEPCGRDT
ncbi:MAG: sugar phosphate nucleotidyltransferase, partial [Limisphaerales bacterium]